AEIGPEHVSVPWRGISARAEEPLFPLELGGWQFAIDLATVRLHREPITRAQNHFSCGSEALLFGAAFSIASLTAAPAAAGVSSHFILEKKKPRQNRGGTSLSVRGDGFPIVT